MASLTINIFIQILLQDLTFLYRSPSNNVKNLSRHIYMRLCNHQWGKSSTAGDLNI